MPSIIDLDREIEKLKTEAVAILDSMFKIPEGYSSGATNRLVECIVSAAILEVANLNKIAAEIGRENNLDKQQNN